MKLILKEYQNFITKDKYISKKEINLFLEKNKSKIKAKNKIIKLLNDYVNLHNDVFIKRKLIEERKYFDEMFKDTDRKLLLDNEQRRVILTDEDNLLVVAGAGSGKTTTMVAKVKYLVERLGVNPKEIVLISFTNKAVLELWNRLSDNFNSSVKIYTFHQLGLSLLKKKNKPFTILTNKEKIIETYLNYYLVYDKEKLQAFLTFFLYYFIKGNKFKKGSLSLILKRKEEVLIAHFLYQYNLNFAYEKVYPYQIGGNPSFPLFTIYYDDEIYYLEYYHLKEKGKDKNYSIIDNWKYRNRILKEKEKYHQNKTILITLYSSYEDGRDLYSHLKEELEGRGIKLIRRNDKKFLKEILKDSDYKRFVLFCIDFLNRFKEKGFTLKTIDHLIEKNKKHQEIILFLTFFKGLYNYYEKELREKRLIDFDDMINKVPSNLKKGNINYKYIIIDEYQDISLPRFNLIKKISLLSGAKVMAVGDDWQTIFSFAGSDITLFTNFKQIMEGGIELQITNTYRNSKELIEVAGNFVMKNKNQIKKRLTSFKRISRPVVVIHYPQFYSLSYYINECLKRIVKEDGGRGTILIMGRYNFEKEILFENNFFYQKDNKLKATFFPHLTLFFLTAHSSKGLGFDHVIIINGSSGFYGFPSQRENNPLMELVSSKNETYKFGEERRLFYVALTRTKNKVYLLAPLDKPSPFIKEIKGLLYVENINFVKRKEKRCPWCNFLLIKKTINSLGIYNLYECSNEKELCGFKTNSLKFKIGIEPCLKCGQGFLIVKQNKESGKHFLGCTNYKKDGTGCNNVKGFGGSIKKR